MKPNDVWVIKKDGQILHFPKAEVEDVVGKEYEFFVVRRGDQSLAEFSWGSVEGWTIVEPKDWDEDSWLKRSYDATQDEDDDKAKS